MTIEFFFQNAWRWTLGLDEFEHQDAIPYKSAPSVEEIANHKFKDEFVKLMRNRMIMGFFRYGYNDPKKIKTYDFILSVKQRIERYEKDGNLEHLVDAANILRMEFEMPHHPNAHFTSIDDGPHSHT
jgi:hypothetical protein